MEKDSASLWLSAAEVEELLTPADAYSAVREALKCHAKGEYIQPLKPYIRPKGREREYEGGRFIAMPAHLGGTFNYAGIKWIAGFPVNIERGLPRASGLMALNSCENGRLLALMPCETLSARRTGAVAAIAYDEFAPHGPQTVGVIGAGPIGETVLDSLLDEGIAKRDICSVRICDLVHGRAERLARVITAKHPLSVQIHSNPQPCIEQSGIVIPATTGSKEYIQEEWMKDDGWLYIGLSLDDARPEELLSADKVIVDDFDQACREETLLHRLVQQGRFSREKIYATIGEILAGKPGRETENEKIYVNPMGMAIEDVAVCARTYEKAVRLGIGQRLV